MKKMVVLGLCAAGVAICQQPEVRVGRRAFEQDLAIRDCVTVSIIGPPQLLLQRLRPSIAFGDHEVRRW